VDNSGSDWVGIDVSKTHLDVCIGRQHRRFRVKDQFDEAVAWISSSQPQGIVVEATGGYERPIATALQQRHAVSVVNPRCVRDFAKSRGRLAKTDVLDAQVLVDFGAANKPRPTRIPSEVEVRLRAAVARRDQVADLRQTAKQHLEHTDDALMLKRAKRLVAALEREVRQLDALVAKIVSQDEALKARTERLRTAPGIGPVIAAGLVVHMPELGTLTKAEAAALAGLAPMNCDSGAMRGQRHIQGGRYRVRKMLFLAATVNQRCRVSPFKDRFQALTQRAKPPKVARVAVARKLLLTLNAMLKNGTDFVLPPQNH
jgi:transposase